MGFLFLEGVNLYRDEKKREREAETDEDSQMPSKSGEVKGSKEKGSGWTGYFDFPKDGEVGGVAP